MEATLAQPKATNPESVDSNRIPVPASATALESESIVPMTVIQGPGQSFADHQSQMNQFLCDYEEGNGAINAIRDPDRNASLCKLFDLLIDDCRSVGALIKTYSPEGIVLKTMARMAAEDLIKVAIPIKERRGLMPYEVEQLGRAMDNIDIVARHYLSALEA